MQSVSSAPATPAAAAPRPILHRPVIPSGSRSEATAAVVAPQSTEPRATATASLTPPASPSPTPPVVARKPNARPRILGVYLNTTDVRSGDTISGSVLTTSNVASVEVRVATYGMGVTKTGVGRFSMSYTVPFVPFFFHGRYPMRFIARNAAGIADERDVWLTVR